jgi:hypothetical protein
MSINTLFNSDAADWSAFFQKYKIILTCIFFAIVSAVIGIGTWKHFENKKKEIYSAKLFEFNKNTFEDFKNLKIPEKLFVESFGILADDIDSYGGIYITGLKGSDILIERGKKEEALNILTILKNKFWDGPLKKYFIGIRLAAVYEDLEAPRRSIDILEELLKSPAKILENKLYLDLGRLYKKVGDLEKSKRNLQYVVDNSVEGEIKKLASLYLSTDKLNYGE